MCVSVNLVCVHLPWPFQPLLGADITQLVPGAGDSTVWAALHSTRAGCALALLDTPPPRVFPFAWVVEHSHFLTSFQNAECFQV